MTPYLTACVQALACVTGVSLVSLIGLVTLTTGEAALRRALLFWLVWRWGRCWVMRSFTSFPNLMNNWGWGHAFQRWF